VGRSIFSECVVREADVIRAMASLRFTSAVSRFPYKEIGDVTEPQPGCVHERRQRAESDTSKGSLFPQINLRANARSFDAPPADAEFERCGTMVQRGSGLRDAQHLLQNSA